MHRITIFHYHLLTGGITQVITSSVKALLRQQPDQFEITLVSGRNEKREELLQKIEDELESQGISPNVRSEHVPELDYLVEQNTPPTVEHIKKTLFGRFQDSIWWIHNYHIGKNPFFTEALVRIAHEHPEQHIIFHIHDFPESGRYANLKALYEDVNTALYPIGQNVRYVVINSRDKNILRGAGIPEQQLFLLNNPIDPPAESTIDFWEVQDKIANWAYTNAHSWQPEGKLLLYPVRTIRRKNIFEAGLLTHLLESPSNLLVTLPGVSKQEQAYSNLVAAAFEKGLIPGAWGIGRYLDRIGVSFQELTRSADVIISTAIQEGFGYLFINSVLWSVPLSARNLDILGGIRDNFSPDSSYFYDDFLVPLSTSDRAALGDTYTQILNSITGLVPDNQHKRINYEVEQLLAEEYIDFSYLSVEQQYQFLKRAAESSEFVAELREINAEMAAVTENLLRGPKVKNRESVIEEFGYSSHAAKINEILGSFEAASPKGTDATHSQAATQAENPPQDPIHQKVLQSFNHLKYLRPLFF